MSTPPRRNNGEPAVLRKGSVRAARERLRAAQQGMMLIGDEGPGSQPPAGSNLLVSQFSPQQSLQHPPPVAAPDSQARLDESSSPQWPLPTAGVENDYAPQPAQQQRNMAPQRPPRPSYVPEILDQTRLPPLQPRGNPQPSSQWPEEKPYASDYPSANSGSRVTASSQDSSIGSIPDFPTPSFGNGSRRIPNMGPPPSARRGPSSYYSQISYVSPIQEESEHRASHGSFASSNVIPSGPRHFYYDDHSPSDEDIPHSPLASGRESRAEDHDESSGLVRKASLGKKATPSLTTIRSGEDLKHHKTPKSKGVNTRGATAHATAAAGTQGGAFATGLSSQGEGPRPASSLSTGTGLLDPSSSDSDDNGGRRQHGAPGFKNIASPVSRTRSPMVPPELRQETGSVFGAASQNPTLSDRVGTRRPPRLNVDAVREAEARGSLTSLPDLIRRATRLAANLDRGKTASRLGFEGWFDQGGDRSKGLDMEKDPRRSASLSDMLASFPPPGLATPTSPRTSRGMSRFPSNPSLVGAQRYDPQYLEKPPEARGRRVCGMRIGIFVFLLFLLFCLVVAAIVIPVALIILPGQNQAKNSGFNSAFGVCQKQLTCSNGGSVTVMVDGSCGCICSSGFTGANCTQQAELACTTTAVQDVTDATVGTSIPRLLEGAQSNFSVPLEASKLLAVFAASNISCAAENALVTFNGLNGRSLESRAESVIPVGNSLVAREPQLAVTTTGGLVVAAPTPTPSSGDSEEISTPNAVNRPVSGPSSRAVDFARIAVLYILQESRSLSNAVLAQERLQRFFTESGSGADGDDAVVDAGNRNLVDLHGLRVRLGNGTTVGGTGNVTTSL